jgi:polysaccharide deacetylase family protein (PEP-CTERM system associated)
MDGRQTLLLSIDFEDWHQLVRRRVGARNWQEPGPGLKRQTQVLLALLDDLGVRATFFVLGMAARAHPELVEAVAERGHEIACHGDAHVPVRTQTSDEFTADLIRARTTIEQLTGSSPVGYRAPAFSITREVADWAYRVLSEHGFVYDASQHDTPRIRDRARPAEETPHSLQSGVWEFPVAVWHTRAVTIPVGGASYWATLPRALVIHGLRRSGQFAGLYLHPQELDPEPLFVGGQGVSVPQRAHAIARAAQRNMARVRAPGVLRAIAERFQLIPYGEAYASLSAGARQEQVQG